LRIALITRRYPPLIGGAEKVLSYLAPALAAEGDEVTVLTSRLDEASPEREEIPTPRGSLLVLRLPTSRRRFVGTWLYMRHLRRALAAIRPDVAYVSMLKHDAYVAVGVGKQLGFPVVLRPEGAGATGDVAWQGWGRFGRTIARRCRRADAIVAISGAIREELQLSGYEPATIHDIPNGVPVPERPWGPRDGWRESPRAVFVGRLAPEKNLRALIEAWPIVRGHFPTARLMLVGDGPEWSSLAWLAHHHLLLDVFEMPGATDDPTPLLRGSDLFVLPSKEEGMSIALLEAMALGLPLVASDIAGNRKLVADGIQGRLAPQDPAGLAAAIVGQWWEFDRAIEMGRRARQRVIESYSIAAVARRHRELFGALIGRA
jgi:glycosyltransferase involved in cell wall biosynthesis